MDEDGYAKSVTLNCLNSPRVKKTILLIVIFATTKQRTRKLTNINYAIGAIKCAVQRVKKDAGIVTCARARGVWNIARKAICSTAIGAAHQIATRLLFHK